MRKIAVSLSKGGVAKHSTSVSLAHGLALQKKRVLLVDTDDQGQDAFLLGVKPPIGLAEVLNEEKSAEEAIFKARPGLWILSGGKSLSGVKRPIARKDLGTRMQSPEAFRKPFEIMMYVKEFCFGGG